MTAEADERALEGHRRRLASRLGCPLDEVLVRGTDSSPYLVVRGVVHLLEVSEVPRDPDVVDLDDLPTDLFPFP